MTKPIKVTVRPAKPGHPLSLIRVFAVHMKKAWVLSYLLNTSGDSEQTGQMPSLI